MSPGRMFDLLPLWFTILSRNHLRTARQAGTQSANGQSPEAEIGPAKTRRNDYKMFFGNSSTNLVVGLAALGLTVVVAGVRMSRRKRARDAAASPEDGAGVEAGSDSDQNVSEEIAPNEPGAEKSRHSGAPEGESLLLFFFLAFVLAVPFWLFGAGKLPLPINLPVSALATFVPVTAASIVSYTRGGFAGVKKLLKRALDYKRIKNKIWYLPALLLMPLISFLSFTVMRLAGLPLPEPIQIPLLMVPVFFILFFIGDLGEELGWTGYAIDPMQNRFGALSASLILGIVWVIWHTVPWLQTGNPVSWILWQGLFSIALRILMVWIYNNTGKSVFAAVLVHDMSNISWSLFPNYGSHYDPFITSLISWLAVIIVLLAWEPRTLARFRAASVSGR